MYTPELTITARRLNLEVGLHVDRLSSDIERTLNPGYDPEFDDETTCRTELVIIDEADRLKTMVVALKSLLETRGITRRDIIVEGILSCRSVEWSQLFARTDSRRSARTPSGIR